MRDTDLGSFIRIKPVLGLIEKGDEVVPWAGKQRWRRGMTSGEQDVCGSYSDPITS